MKTRQSQQSRQRFPLPPRGLTRPLSEEPVFLDGMEVLFDVTVGLYPVQLARKKKMDNSADVPTR